MARFIAITEKPDLTEDQFRQALNRTGKWRFHKRGWVVKAYCSLDPGQLIVECEALDQSHVENFLSANGWQAKQINRVNYIHEGGLIWPMRH